MSTSPDEYKNEESDDTASTKGRDGNNEERKRVAEGIWDQCNVSDNEIEKSDSLDDGNDDYDDVEQEEQLTKKRKVENEVQEKTREEIEVESIFVNSCTATTQNLSKSLIDYLIGSKISYEGFNSKNNPVWIIVQNCRSRYAKNLSLNTSLKWFGLDYKDELKRTKEKGSAVSYKSKVEMMSRFMKEIKEGLKERILEREKVFLRGKFSIITDKIFWYNNVGVRFVSSPVCKSSELGESRIFNLYIRKDALTVNEEYQLNKKETSANLIECFYKLFAKVIIIQQILYHVTLYYIIHKLYHSYVCTIYYIIL
jgi:hypothetical protein